MEDNYKDKYTEDQAWNMMRLTLDKELPVENNRRIAIWWFLSALLGIGLLIFWITFYMGYNTAVEVNPEPVQENTIENKSSVENVIANKSLIEANKTSSEKSKLKNIEAEFSNASMISNTDQSKVGQNNNVIKNANKIARTTISQKAIVKTVDVVLNGNDAPSINTVYVEKQSIAVDKLINIAAPVKTQESYSDRNLVKGIAKSSIDDEVEKDDNNNMVNRQNIAFVPISNLPSLSLETIEAGIQDLASKNVQMELPQRSKWEVAIQSSLLRHIDELNNLNLEFTIARALKPKWKIGTGLGYKVVSIPTPNVNGEDTFNPSMRDIEIFNNTNEDQIVTGADLSFESSTIRTRNLIHYACIPLFFEYHLKNRWALMGGMRANLLLRYAGSRKLTRSYIREITKRILIYDNIDFYVGPVYSLSPHWSIGARMQYSTKLFRNVQRKAYQYQVGINVAHQF